MVTLLRPLSRGITMPQPGVSVDMSHPLAEEMRGCWIFGDTGSRTIFNLTGTRDGDLRLNSGAAWGPEGMRGSSSANGAATSGVPNSFLATPFTMLVRASATAFTNSYNSLVSFESSGAGYTILVKSTGKLAIYVNKTVGNVSFDGTGSHTLTTLKTYSLAMTWDGTTLYGYVDGVEDGTAAGAGTMATPTGTLKIGDTAFPTRNWPGTISQAMYWSRIVSRDQLLWLAQEPYAFLEPPAPRFFVMDGSRVARPSVITGSTSIPSVVIDANVPATTISAVTTFGTHTILIRAFPATVQASVSVGTPVVHADLGIETITCEATVGYPIIRNGFWKLVDLESSETYEFNISPSQESIDWNKATIYENTLGPQRRTLIVEEQPDLQELRLEGTLLTQEQYETLLDWYERRHQINVVDDLGRIFTVYLREFSPKRERKASEPWFHTYTINAVIVP